MQYVIPYYKVKAVKRLVTANKRLSWKIVLHNAEKLLLENTYFAKFWYTTNTSNIMKQEINQLFISKNLVG